MLKYQASSHKADYDHEPELDKESHFTLCELNYDKTLVQVQINYDWCRPPSTIMILVSVKLADLMLQTCFTMTLFCTEDKVKRFFKKILQ